MQTRLSALPHSRESCPGTLAKQGTHYDVPMALGLLVEQGILKQDACRNVLVIGELGLDGTIRPVHGALLLTQFAKSVGHGTGDCPSNERSRGSLY